MATRTEVKPLAAEKRPEKTYDGLTGEQLLQIYRLMHLSRRMDDREVLLKRQQKIFFQVSCAGHEAVLVTAGLLLKPGYDWFYPYYRDRALCLALGVPPLDMMLQAVGAADDPASGGRQMPSHWSDPKLNIVTGSSPTGTQLLQSVGCAEAGRYFARHPEAAKRPRGPAEAGAGQAIDYRQFKDVAFHGDEITFVSTGEGSTSEGEFWETMNTVSNEKLPVLMLIEDNEYAISVPVEAQTPGGNISRLVANFPHFHFDEFDGTDVFASHSALKKAIDYIRSGKGPVFLHAHVVRPYSHSLSDDERSYRPDAERQEQAKRDPITKLQMFLLREGLLDHESLVQLEAEVDLEVQQATDQALAAAPASPDSVSRYIYSPNIDPTSASFAVEPAQPAAIPGEAASSPAPEKTMADLIGACLSDELRRDDCVVIFGEDVADCSRDQYLQQKLVKGKGGVFKLTAGLQTQYGSDRVFNSPLAEANIVGRAIGMATRGLKPVVEIQFFDYIWPAMHQMRNELPLIRWRSNNDFSCPLVIRVAIGGYLTGGGIYHSQSGESIFTHIPGLRVIFPSNALDANGLLRTAIRCDDPVLFLEHKRLYRETYGRAPYPGPDYTIPFGKAKVVQAGSDVTVITYGAVVPRALQAAQRAQRERGISVEIVDLRSLSPYDWEAIAESVRKTHRVLVAYEDTLSWGYGAEIAARIADELFDDLEAPVRRVAALDSFVAYQPLMENVILPQPAKIFDAITSLAGF
ncbi:MAG TPA: dehydrogenase E1 component subunit alpha/beta [Terriglobales bacterium]|nr:dehydrogenase E1 component subunit alpha/beta [Terriglobales bacterium]